MATLAPIQFSQAPKDIRLARPALLPADWEDQLRQAECRGFQNGVIEGERKLGEELIRQRADLIQLQNGALAALQQAVPQVVRQTEDAMVNLAFEIAQKLVSDLPLTREMVSAVVRESIEHIEDTTEFNVQLHPDDLALLSDNPLEALGGEAVGRKIRFSPVRELTRGGCVVHTRFGIIDSRRETKLARIAESLAIPT